MKLYRVSMYKLSLVSLSQNPDCRPAKYKLFDSEQEAIMFAKSQRQNWDHVTIHKTGTDEEVVNFHGDDMYVGTKKTRLKPEE